MGKINITELHRSLIAMDSICMFINQIKDNDISYDKPNFTTKDYWLDQLLCFIKKQIPHWMTIYEYQSYIGKNISRLKMMTKPRHKVLNSKKS